MRPITSEEHNHAPEVPANPIENGPVQSVTADLETRFRRLADQWRLETGMFSSVSQKMRHPAYQEIIAMGKEVLPLILKELRDRPGHWFEALKAIAKETPVPPEDRSSAKRARECWLQWGKERGLLE